MRLRLAVLLSLLTVAFPATAVAPGPRLTVVFESGLGDGAAVWRDTIARLGHEFPTFAYARPGYDGTSATDAPRDPCTIAEHLHDRLVAAGRAPPYLLVGHSLGGQYAYAFARLYPNETSGLVLVDATPPGHWQAIRDRLPAVARLVSVVRAIKFSQTMAREFDAQDQCLDHLPKTRLPFAIRVLVKTKADPGGGERLLDMQRELAQTWLGLTGAARIEPVEGAGHYIQRERPAAVVEAIREIVSSLPERKTKGRDRKSAAGDAPFPADAGRI